MVERSALDTLVPEQQHGVRQHYLKVALDAVAREGLQTLMLPSATVTAYHEAGHAVSHAADGNPPSEVAIWHEPRGHGYAGHGDFPPGSPEIYVNPLENPDEAIRHGCMLIAGLAAENTVGPSQARAGSSLDEAVVAGGLANGIGQVTGVDPFKVLQAMGSACTLVFKVEAGTVRTIQRRLVAERRIRGRKLAEVLSPVQRVDLPALVKHILSCWHAKEARP